MANAADIIERTFGETVTPEQMIFEEWTGGRDTIYTGEKEAFSCYAYTQHATGAVQHVGLNYDAVPLTGEQRQTAEKYNPFNPANENQTDAESEAHGAAMAEACTPVAVDLIERSFAEGRTVAETKLGFCMTDSEMEPMQQVGVNVRMQRILSLLHPETDTLGQGYGMLRLREILGSCRFIGLGDALPHHTEQWLLCAGNDSVRWDYFLAFIMYRYGCIAAIPPIVCMGAFLAIAIRRACRLSSTLGRVLSYGVLTVLAVQTVFSLMTNFGFPLWVSAVFPFVSYGNTAFLADLLLCGVLYSLFSHDADFSDTPYQRRRLRVRFEVSRSKGEIL